MLWKSSRAGGCRRGILEQIRSLQMFARWRSFGQEALAYTLFMLSCSLRAVIFFWPVFVFAQLDSNSVTVTASRSATLTPDQVVFQVTIGSGLNTSLDDVIAALQGAGITVANFSGVSSPGALTTVNAAQPSLEWTFVLAAPLAKLKDTASSLSNVEQNIRKQNQGLQMTFAIQGTQVSQQLAQSQPCVIADLLADAQAQAQKLAGPAGLAVGTILAMSSNISSAASNGAPSLSSLLSTSPPPCNLTVKFAVIRLQ